MPMIRMLALEPIVVNGVAYNAGDEFEMQASAARHLPEGFAEPVEVKDVPKPVSPRTPVHPIAKKVARRKRGKK